MSAFISVDQLRNEIGDPSEDTRVVGHITDDMLRNIIERHEDLATYEVYRRLSSGAITVNTELASIKSITIAVSSKYVLLGEGTIPTVYFPWALFVTNDAGDEFYRDSNIMTLATIDDLFTRRRYHIVGRKIFTLPNTSDTIQVLLVTVDDMFNFVASDLIEPIRQQIIREAKEMLAARIAEQGRLLRSDMGD